MSLDKYRANKKLTEKISESIKSGMLFHAYIIEGDSLSDKENFAKEFCKAIVCMNKPGIGCDECANCRKIEHGNYEDLHIVESDGMSVKDEQIEKLQEKLKRKPMGDRNIAVIKDADTLTVRAQNRLLKTLEEPFEGTVIMLLSENRENLLDTIKSRCIMYRLEDTEKAPEEMPGGKAAELLFQALLEEKRFVDIKQMLSSQVKSREEAFSLLDGLERIYERLLVGLDDRHRTYRKDEIIRAVELLEEARRDLLAKVNYQYAIKNLIIKIGGTGW